MILSRERISFFPATVTELSDWSRGYQEMRVARRKAQDQGMDSSQSPLPFSHLQEEGVRDLFLVLMLYHGHVEQFRPAAKLDNGRLLLEPTKSLRLLSGSFFTLTEAGEAFANTLLAVSRTPVDANALRATWEDYCPPRLAPHFERESRVLRWGCQVLKRFRQPSANQELILLAAEELKWPEWFDDPLPRRPGTNPKVRLHNTIKDLNRRQTPHLVHFKGDGTGTRLGWEYC